MPPIALKLLSSGDCKSGIVKFMSDERLFLRHNPTGFSPPFSRLPFPDLQTWTQRWNTEVETILPQQRWLPVENPVNVRRRSGSHPARFAVCWSAWPAVRGDEGEEENVSPVDGFDKMWRTMVLIRCQKISRSTTTRSLNARLTVTWRRGDLCGKGQIRAFQIRTLRLWVGV